MNRKELIANRSRAARRARRTRAKISGTASCPRLSVFRSLRHISVQLIDDVAGRTLAASSDALVKAEGKKPLEVAALVGADIGVKAKALGVTKAVFDRGSYLYHGRVKALADGARANGLVF